MMPLQMVYVNDKKKSGKINASFGFGSGTLQGHLLVSLVLALLVIKYSYYVYVLGYLHIMCHFISTG